jgi:hypothetical protein
MRCHRPVDTENKSRESRRRFGAGGRHLLKQYQAKESAQAPATKCAFLNIRFVFKAVPTGDCTYYHKKL